MQVRGETHFMCGWLGVDSDLLPVSRNLHFADELCGYFLPCREQNQICSQKPRLYFMSVRVRLILPHNISLASWAMNFSGLLVFFLFLLPSPSQEQQGARQVCVLQGCAWAYSCGCSTSLQWPQQFLLQRTLAASAVRNPQTSLVQSRLWGLCSQQKYVFFIRWKSVGFGLRCKTLRTCSPEGPFLRSTGC